MPKSEKPTLDSVLDAWADARSLGEDLDIDDLCEGDAELALAARVRLSKLTAIENALGLSGEDHPTDQPFGVGHRLGGYELVRAVGEGGFGVVFEAKRTDGLLGRFAVKVLSRSMYSPDARARFTDEGKALSLAKHEHIASVIDAGVSDQGVPYLVMDYIEGQTLIEHCASKRLDVKHRLSLFLQACAAVEHAHAKGVIHRDLKPGNMLVQIEEDKPNLKVIDFGIARISDDHKQPRRRFTQEGELIGTAAYMSPEQFGIGGSEPDIHSDIYSLGVILYELVSGWLPYQREPDEQLTTYELQRRLNESGPTSLTSRFRSTTRDEERDSNDPFPTLPDMAGVGDRELNWIVMKCIAIEPERRYANCRALADDIRRLLEGRPVLAGPQSRAYTVRKFISRHKLGTAFAAVLLVTIVAAATLTSYGLISAVREGKRAIKAEEETRRVADFQAQQLASIDVSTMGDSIKEQILSRLPSAPGTDSQATISQIEALLGEIQFADVSTRVLQDNIFAPSIETAIAQFENEPLILGRLLRSAGVAQTLIGLNEEGLETHRFALDFLTESLGEDNQQTLLALTEYANTLRVLGRSDEAEPLLRDALKRQSRLFGPTAIPTLTMRNDYAMILFGLGRAEESAEHLQSIVQTSGETLGESHNLTATIQGNLGDVLDHLGRTDEAFAHHLASLAAIEAEFGPHLQATIIAKNNLGKSLVVQGKYKEAMPLLEEAVTLGRQELGEQHPTTLLALSNLAITLNRTGQYERAFEVNRDLLDSRLEILGSDHPNTIISMNAQAKILFKLGRINEAQALARQTVERASEILGPDRYETAIFRSTLARALGALDQHEEAGRIFESVHLTLENTIGVDNIYAQENIAEAIAMYKRLDESHPEAGYTSDLARWESRLIAPDAP
ncbi:MAG: tetratricopeptide repeat protein [Phycisphaerales bacterium JB058]